MTAATPAMPLVSEPPLRRRAWWLLVAIHIPSIAFTIAQGGLRLAFPGPGDHASVALGLMIVAGAIQMRHSFAAANGIRPRYWPWTLALLLLIAYGSLLRYADQTMTAQWFVVASFAMLLPLRVATILSITSAVLTGIWFAIVSQPFGSPLSALIWSFFYWQALQFLGSAGLYGATRLVRLMDQLRDARAELAELAIGRERLRISRDLHDLLGQSLSAVSLKGDLAIGLLAREQIPRATGEIQSLVSVARSALHDLRDIAHREPPIALRSEIDRASDLLAATGTDTRVDIGVDHLPPPIDELFAWALREGITNVLRHSAAKTCTIAITRIDRTIRLEIVNDAAMPMAGIGNGLSGLATRAAALSGVASARALGDGRFRLRVDVPEAMS